MISKIKAAVGNVATRWLGDGVNVGYTGGNFWRERQSGIYTAAGTTINEDTAMSIPALFHAARTYAQVLGQLEWSLIRADTTTANGRTVTNRHVATGHPSHRLVHDEPNEYQVSSSFRETLILHRFFYGAGYAYIERNGNQRPTALVPLLPDRTYPTRKDGRLQFQTSINGQERTLEADEVYYLPGISMDGLTPVPLVKRMASALGLTKAEEEWAAAYFRNMMGAPGYFKLPGKLSEEAFSHLQTSLNEKHSGLANAYRWPLLEEGLEAVALPQPDADKAQLIASRQFSLTVMAQVAGLAPHLLYDLSRSTNNNIEAQGIEAVNYSFAPVANKLCEEARRKLLYESEKDVYRFELDLNPLTRGSAKEQAETDQILFNCASITPNQIRGKRGLNPVEGGDECYVNIATLPVNLVVQQTLANIEAKLAETAQAKAAAEAANQPAPDPVTKDDLAAAIEQAIKTAAQTGSSTDDPNPNDDPTPQGGDTTSDGPAAPAADVEDVNEVGVRSARALVPVARDTIGRLMRRHCKEVGAGVDRHGSNPEALATWAESYQQDCRQQLASGLLSVCQSVEALTGQPVDADALAGTWAAETVADLRRLTPETAADDKALLLEGYQGERIEKLVAQLVGD